MDIKVGNKVRFEYYNWDEDKEKCVTGVGRVKEIEMNNQGDIQNATVYVQTTRVFHFMDYGAVKEIIK